MSEMVIFYLIIPAAMLALWILSRDIELPSGMVEKGISREFLKISLFIYRKLKRKIKRTSSGDIRTYLGILGKRSDIETAETEYFIRKISIVLLMAVAGSILSIAMCISSARNVYLTDDKALNRNEFFDKGGEYQVSLAASNEAGGELGEYDFKVVVRQLTDSEADEYFERASEELERVVLGENESLDEVRERLNLVERLPGYPFDIRWRIDNYEVMHFDGEPIAENIPEDGIVIGLTATFKYEDRSWQKLFSARLLPRELTYEERLHREIVQLLDEADEDSRTSDKVILPRDYSGHRIVWNERKEDNSILLLILTVIGGATSYVMKDRELKSAMEKRKNRLLADYPKLVSKLALYMGAGMTMRGVFERLAKSDSEQGYLLDEIKRANRELQSGASEAEVYEHFGIRCGGQQYARLSTLLSQNLKKGNSELLKLLGEESKKAFDDRMDKVRKAGEEAGTRLLLPMIIMLLIVMVIIMIPAYLAF